MTPKVKLISLAKHIADYKKPIDDVNWKIVQSLAESCLESIEAELRTADAARKGFTGRGEAEKSES